MQRRDRKTPRDALAAAAAAAVPLFPPAALLLAAALHTSRRRLPPLRPWLVAWAGFVLPIGVSLVGGAPDPDLILQAVGGIAIGALFTVRRARAVLIGLTIGLAILAAAAGLERELSRALWSDAAPRSAVELLRGVSALDANSPGWRRNDVRIVPKTWRLAEGTTQLELSFDARTLASSEPWQWYTNSPRTTQELVADDAGGTFTRIAGSERPIVRRARVERPIGGTRVRASFDTRASASLTGEPCSVQLRTFAPSFHGCETLVAGAEWARYAVEYTFPAAASGRAFELAIGPVPGELELRDVRIETFLDGDWITVDPVEPAGAHVRLPVPSEHLFAHPTLHVDPTPDWQRFTLVAEHEALASLDRATFLLHLESGTRLELRNVTLRATDGARRQPLATPTARSGVWLDHPNTLGHTAAALGATALVLALGRGAARWGLLAFAFAVACVFLSGSRAAWLGVALAGVWLLPLLVPARLRTPGRLVAAAIVVGLAVAGGGAIDRFDLTASQDGNTIARTEIWATAVAAWRHDPLRGGGPDAISAAWVRERPDDGRSAPAHAHNLWLGYAAAYGTPGLVAIAWLSVVLFVIAWRRGGPTGVGLVAAVMLMNVFDLTLTSAGVLAAVVLGLAALPLASARDRRREASG
ncbi:MAG: O-antigen ligase family protein [Trueperaceae bacterium]|nr:O-antigen ligase family protein [Trueperaceae bacterium]